MNETRHATCRFCGDDIPLNRGYCKPCFAAYARRRRETLRATRKNGHNGAYHFFGPGWLMPNSVPQVLATITASIVWGVCGRMADVPEY